MGGHEDQAGSSALYLPADAQIKTRERVQSLAEVYTHQREVDAMLDLVQDMFPSAEDPENTDRTFLEPACGHGNFLVEILRRKLVAVTARRYGKGEGLEYRALRCLTSTYGVDINEGNVDEARERMRAVVTTHVERELADSPPTEEFREAVGVVLDTNIVCANTLADAAGIELIEYRPSNSGTFIREWSRPLDPSAGELNLFAVDPRRDAVPVHYSALACQPEPTRADTVPEEVA